jgi:hypothetical protein
MPINQNGIGYGGYGCFLVHDFIVLNSGAQSMDEHVELCQFKA